MFENNIDENYQILALILVLLSFFWIYLTKFRSFLKLTASYLPINSIRIFIFRICGTNIGKNCKIGFGTVIGHDVKIGDRTQISENAYVGSGTRISSDCNIESFVKLYMCNIGKNTDVRWGVNLSGHIDRKLEIGSDCIIGRYSILDGYKEKIIIGNSVHIGPLSCIWTHSAMFNVVSGISHKSPEYPKKIMRKGVIFEDDIWTGNSITVYSGVTVSRKSAIMPNSVIDKDVETGAIVGNPSSKTISKLPKSIFISKK